eukprot:scpid52641/ scgid31522/ 
MWPRASVGYRICSIQTADTYTAMVPNVHSYTEEAVEGIRHSAEHKSTSCNAITVSGLDSRGPASSVSLVALSHTYYASVTARTSSALEGYKPSAALFNP